MAKPTKDQIRALGPVPADLAGFQLLCGHYITLGDLVIGAWTNAKPEWALGLVGRKTDGEGVAANCRAYRRIPVAKPEGWTGPKPGDVHHSKARPEESRRSSPAFARGGFEVPDGDGHALPTDAAARKRVPIATGVVDYFPDALAEIARVSLAGNEQHNAGKPLHWDKTKSTDESDALMRHFMQRGTRDTDGQLHSAKVAWRALALLQREIEAWRAS